MKRYTLLFLLITTLASILAAPVRRGIINLTQPNGETLQALFWGDEFMTMYSDLITGNCLIQDDATKFWRPMTDAEVKTASSDWTESRRLAAMANNRYLLGGSPTKGGVHMPVLLVQFSDLKFSEHYGSVAFFDSLFNMKDYDRVAFTNNGTEYHSSSVRNYFNTQSLGKFDFQADIIGPITVSKNYAYYGANSGSLKDVNFSQLYTEAIQLAMKEGYLNDAKKYDGDNDGNVDILYMVYAGWGENENGITDYIWAKNSSTSIKTTDNTYINNICASCELRSNGSTLTQDPDGIGVLVHEFSHALGLPDFYPVHSDGDGLYQRYGMDSWSVMDQGNYSGMGQIPNGYTAHERMKLGWISESDLDTVPTIGRVVLPPFGSSGKAMILRNPLNANEYITLENHCTHDNLWEQCWGNSSYFTGTTNKGLLITHVDYVQSQWNSNSVNDRSLHQYCNPLPADGKLWSYEGFLNEANALASKGDIEGARTLNSQWKLDLRADIFPGYNNVTTLNGSNPKAKWYTGDTMAINITNIRQLEDGSLELTFGNYEEIVDGVLYNRNKDVNATIKYTRTFGSTTWQALYVPFSIPVEKLSEKGLTVAELNDTHQWDLNGDGIADSTRIEFFTLTSGSTQANYPYLIKADVPFDLTLELDNIELKAAEENSYDCSSMKQKFTFVGTYSGVSGSEMYENNYYAMADGSLKRPRSAAANLTPQRWYLKIENRNGSPVQYFAPSIRFSIDGIDEEPEATGLDAIIVGNDSAPIYSLDGMRQDPSRLTRGVYVQNGKKVIVR